jgi:phosphatidylglycerophosphate synthase
LAENPIRRQSLNDPKNPMAPSPPRPSENPVSARPEVASLALLPFVRVHYRRSLKSARSDEWINTYLIRPAAFVLVWLFYRLRLRPVQVVLLGALAGTLCAPALLFIPGRAGPFWAGICLLAKNLLDAADGQLARATGRVDRVGRFADSIADFWVNAVVTLCCGAALSGQLGLPRALCLSAAAFLLLVLQCSLFVFYQISYLNRAGHSPANRPSEQMTAEDRAAPPLERRLQRIYLALYGWQDRWMAALDRLLFRSVRPDAKAGIRRTELEERWFGDAVGLRLTSFLGLGTSLTVFGICLLLGSPRAALLWILLGENAVAAVAILYRLLWLAPSLSRAAGPAGGVPSGE